MQQSARNVTAMSSGLAVGRGLTLGCLTGIVTFGLLAVSGVVSSESGFVFLVGALAALGFGLSPPSRPRLEAFGSMLVGLVGLVAGAVSGFGWLEYSVIAGAILGAFWLATGGRTPLDPWRWSAWGWFMAPLLLVVLLPLVLDGGTLGHDESAYALKARQWLEGTPGTGWSPHRATGMSVYGYAVLAMGGAEPGLRMLGLGATIALASGAWALAKRLADVKVAFFASIAVVAGPAVLFRGTEYLSDLPAAALLVFCMVVVWREFEDRELPGWRILWVLPLAWGAFYLRYQSALSLALLGIIMVALWWPKIRRRPAPVLMLVGLGLVGLIPHFKHSIDLRGTPWGILLNTSGAVRAYVGEGLVDYASQIAWDIAGYVGPVALIAAVVGVVVSRGDRNALRRYLFLLVPAVAQVLVLGLISHGEPRFIFFPLALIVMAGIVAIDALLKVAGTTWREPVVLAFSVLLVGSLAISASQARESVASRVASNEPVELAAVEVAGIAGDLSCGVLTSYSPQITFYSGCFTEVFGVRPGPEESVEHLRGDAKFMVLIEDGKRQPLGGDLEGFIDLTSGAPVVIVTDRGGALVYTFEG